jgi:UDP-N-acetylmuramyl pentapeptide phosphotransferase/UDP-N-acetylglucosamine-1-phosphate transferase
MFHPAVPYEFLATFVAAVFLWLTKRWHQKWTANPGRFGHATHTKTIPRIGGLAIVLGLLVARYRRPELELLQHCLSFGLVAFGVGFIEDLSQRITPPQRLLMCLIGGLLVATYGGHIVASVGIPQLDVVLRNHQAALLFTAFAIAGLCSAINMIDGKNGLAGGSVAISLLGVYFIASQHGMAELAQVALTLVWVIAGFLVINWPLGRLFMGDGGAYLLGFALALCVIDLAASGEVSPWASLLLVIYPVTEVLDTIWRRLRNGDAADLPDQAHLHHLVSHAVVDRWFGGFGQTSRNSLVAAVMLPVHAVWVAVAVARPTQSWQVAGVCAIAFAAHTLVSRLLSIPIIVGKDD